MAIDESRASFSANKNYCVASARQRDNYSNVFCRFHRVEPCNVKRERCHSPAAILMLMNLNCVAFIAKHKQFYFFFFQFQIRRRLRSGAPSSRV